MRVDLPSSTEPQVLKRRMSMGAVGAEADVERAETEETVAEGAEDEGAITVRENLGVARSQRTGEICPALRAPLLFEGTSVAGGRVEFFSV